MGDRSEADRFTALERIAVIVVVTLCVCFGLLGLLQAITWRDSVEQGDVAATKAQIKQFDTALTAYKIRFGNLPDSLDQLLHPPSGAPIMNAKAVPVDPWGTPFLYLKLDTKAYLTISLGANGIPGGEGVDADIRSDEISNEAAK